ncbi:DUF488 domain-containing protein [Demequina lutea]|uniref:Uncharacterized protein (DUF488 family) n=1 Tax=Demequina lutea TaxID=431489 RepID=A0A7Z0CL67_9MICO|nr:DUF488 domain-containing protein [Demequina lutea]NYI42613.1 uncharacterized protein (DUF488 family) [Demequina lutea]
MGSGITGWGYEGRTVADLVEFARAMGAAWIVDVRLNPISRKAGFSKRALAQAVADAGLDYLHLPALGNPRDNRAAFADASGPQGAAARARYTSEVLATDAAAEALNQVRALGAHDGVVLVCFEADGRCCHRTEVLHALNAARLAA